MTYQNSDIFSGDNIYSIDCTGDCCTGDEVKFSRAVFSGSYRNPKFSHMENIEGTIVKESYGVEKQQHTFTIKKTNGEVIRIKGRNLYRNNTYRKSWGDEDKRKIVLKEKHSRGDNARKERFSRKENHNSLYS